MKILFFTLSNELAASSRTRIFQYIPHLQQKGIDIKVIKYESGLNSWLAGNFKRNTFLQKMSFFILQLAVKIFHVFYSFLADAKLILFAGSYDIVFIQKALIPAWVQKMTARRNNKIVFDFDDAIYADKTFYNADRFNSLLSYIKLAVIENESTENYMKSRGIKTLKITGPIDCERYKPSNNLETKNISIGWIGSPSTAVYLKMIEKPLQFICHKYPNTIINIIGASGIKTEGCIVINENWSLSSEVELLEKFNIGIMPLPDNEWTRGKGGYKILQYMAMGIPAIASPVGVNKELIIHNETGMLVSSEEEWIDALEKLIFDKNLRVSMGQKARKRAEAVYSFETNTEVLLNGLQKLLEEN